MRKLSYAIRAKVEELGEVERKGGDALGLLLRKAKSTLKPLKVGLTKAKS